MSLRFELKTATIGGRNDTQDNFKIAGRAGC